MYWAARVSSYTLVCTSARVYQKEEHVWCLGARNWAYLLGLTDDSNSQIGKFKRRQASEWLFSLWLQHPVNRFSIDFVVNERDFILGMWEEEILKSSGAELKFSRQTVYSIVSFYEATYRRNAPK